MEKKHCIDSLKTFKDLLRARQFFHPGDTASKQNGRNVLLSVLLQMVHRPLKTSPRRNKSVCTQPGLAGDVSR